MQSEANPKAEGSNQHNQTKIQRRERQNPELRTGKRLARQSTSGGSHCTRTGVQEHCFGFLFFSNLDWFGIFRWWVGIVAKGADGSPPPESWRRNFGAPKNPWPMRT
jgi:hypothetical protein